MIELVVVAAMFGLSATLLHRRRVAGRIKDEPCEGRVLERGRFEKLELEVLGRPPEFRNDVKTPGPNAPKFTAGSGRNGRNGFAVPLASAAVLDGAVPAIEYGWAWSQVDEHLFQAVEHMTHESVQSIGDLGRAISEHDWAVNSWTGADAGLVASVKGHLGEWLAADHLMQAGHSVAMPTASNQAGWDLLIDGHEVNVKTVGDAAAHLRDHFAAHPDIGVLLPADAAHIPVDALHLDSVHAVDIAGAAQDGHLVLVDQALSNADAADAAQNGLEVAAGNMDAHLPWITMAVSSFREGRLLFRGDTDLLRAAKNVAVDTVAVGGGAMLGAKAGAAIGTAIAPGVGSLIGGLIGGVAGGLLGRKGANAVKRAPLNDAREMYETAAQSFRETELAVTRQATEDWQNFQDVQKKVLAAEARSTEERARVQIRKARQQLQDAMALEPSQARQLLADTRNTLVREQEEAETTYRGIPWWKRWVWPSEETLRSRSDWKERSAFLANWDQQRLLVAPDTGSVGRSSTPRVFDLALCTEAGEVAARTHLTRVGLARAKAVANAEIIRGQALGTVMKARKNTVARLRVRQREIVNWVKQQMESAAQPVELARDNLEDELRKAGVPVG